MFFRNNVDKKWVISNQIVFLNTFMSTDTETCSTLGVTWLQWPGHGASLNPEDMASLGFQLDQVSYLKIEHFYLLSLILVE